MERRLSSTLRFDFHGLCVTTTHAERLGYVVSRRCGVEWKNSGMSIQSVPALQLIDVSKHYQDRHRTVLGPVNINVAEAEFLTIVGPSGSGKTTLLRIIAGLDPPSTGNVYIRGTRMTDVAPHRRN